MRVTGQCSNGDAMLRFHQQEQFLRLFDHCRLRRRMMRQEVLYLPDQTGLVLKMILFGLAHRMRCNDHVQLDTMFLRSQSGVI